jgi:site-specific recombinase XerD
MKPDDFPGLVQRFFADYLAAQRNLTVETRTSYRTAFRLLLRFLSQYHGYPIDRLTLAAFTPEAILAFLAHLESSRGNLARTRNLRLAAIRAFVRFVLGQSTVLDFLASGQRILAIPQKKFAKRLPGFMSRDEIEAIFAATTQSTWSGRRDLLLFLLLYNTGARISEALKLCPKDLQDRSVQLHGKGRKNRVVPVWARTARLLRGWCKTNRIAPEGRIFLNHRGGPLSSDGVTFRLRLAVRKAAAQCPSLNGRRITSHRFRNSCAMALLQSGVALEVISLYLGHASPRTTHDYVEADLKMKAACMRRLTEPKTPKHSKRNEPSRLLAFLEGVP